MRVQIKFHTERQFLRIWNSSPVQRHQGFQYNDSTPTYVGCLTNLFLIVYLIDILYHFSSLNRQEDFKIPPDNLVTLYHVLLVALHSSTSRQPRGLKRAFATVRLLQWRFGIPPESWKSVSCECCVLQEEFYLSGCSVIQRSPTECDVSECDREYSSRRKLGPIRCGWPMKNIQNIYFTYIYHSQIWHRNKLPRCQLETLVSCSNDEHQTSLKWDRSSHPVAPERRVSHTLRLKHFKIKVSVPFEPSCLVSGSCKEYFSSLRHLFCVIAWGHGTELYWDYFHTFSV